MSKVLDKPTGKSSLRDRRKTVKKAGRVVTSFAGTTTGGRARGPVFGAAIAAPVHLPRSVTHQLPARESSRSITFDRLADMAPEARERAVIAGLPATVLDQAAEKLGLSQRGFLAALKIAPTTVARNKTAGNALSVDDSDRVARLAQLWHDTMVVFEHEQGSRAWLTGRVPALDGIPLELVLTSQGFNRARTAILQLAYGVYA